MSNMACNTFVYSAPIIGAMHETMKRLYEAAKAAGVEGQSNVASKMTQSPQTLNNWERRGMSKGGMLIAQRVFGCSAVWLETGEGSIGKALEEFSWILEHGTESEKSILLATVDAIKSMHKQDFRAQALPVIRDRRKKA